MTDILPPHSVEAEQTVLGSILVNAAALDDVIDWLRADDFYNVRHAWIYEAMLAIEAAGGHIDYMMLCHELEDIGRLAEVGGAAYLLTLSNKEAHSLNLVPEARRVRALAERRRMIDAAGQIARLAHSGELDIEDAKAQAQGVLDEALYRESGRGPEAIAALVSAEYDRQDDPSAASPCLIDLAKYIMYSPQKLVIIAARPSMGKTAYILDDMLYNAQNGIPVGIVSLEQSKEELTRRFLCKATGFSYYKIKGKRFDTAEEWATYTRATSELSELPILITDKKPMTELGLRGEVRKMVRSGVAVIYLDYIQLLYYSKPTGSPYADMTKISQAVKLCAGEFDIPIVAACQLNRECEKRADKRPMLSDLRDTGAFEQDADAVAFLHREVIYDRDAPANEAEILIAKNRNGKTGKVWAVWRGPAMSFHNAARIAIDVDNGRRVYRGDQESVAKEPG